MPALRKLTFRLDVMLFSVNRWIGMILPGDPEDGSWAKVDGELFDRHQRFMPWLAATCVDGHPRLKYASWMEGLQMVGFWGEVKGDCVERVRLTVELGRGGMRRG